MENTKNNMYEKMYKKVLDNFINGDKENNIRKILDEISSNNKLSKKDKENIYENIFEYVIEINKCFESKIEEIHKNGIKEGSLMSFYFENINKEKKVDRQIDLELDDFILERIRDNSRLDNNTDYIKSTKKIEKLKNNIKDSEISLIDKIYDLYEFKTDIKVSEAYKIGFKDSLKFFLEIYENKLDIK